MSGQYPASQFVLQVELSADSKYPVEQAVHWVLDSPKHFVHT